LGRNAIKMHFGETKRKERNWSELSAF